MRPVLVTVLLSSIICRPANDVREQPQTVITPEKITTDNNQHNSKPEKDENLLQNVVHGYQKLVRAAGKGASDVMDAAFGAVINPTDTWNRKYGTKDQTGNNVVQGFASGASQTISAIPEGIAALFANPCIKSLFILIIF
jgi:hypothetical protein